MMKRFGLMVGLVGVLVCAGAGRVGVADDGRAGSQSPESIIENLQEACTPVSAIGIDPLDALDCWRLPQSLPQAEAAGVDMGCAIQLPILYAGWRGVDRWMSGNPGAGGQTYFGSLGRGEAWTIGTVLTPGEYVEVEIRFSPDTVTLCQIFRIDLNYDAIGVGTFPGSAWDVSNPLNPRRLNICFSEWDDDFGPNDTPNFRWDPDSTTGPPSFGKWEFLYIMLSSYDGSGLSYQGLNIYHNDLDVLYTWYPRLEPGHTFGEAYPASIDIKLFDQYTNDEIASPGDTQNFLTWTYCGPITHFGFRILYGTDDDPTMEAATIAPTARAFIHTGLTNDVTYYYRIEILGSQGEVIGVGDVFSARPQQQSSNIDLLGRWGAGGSYGDLWGYTDSVTGREYALICSRTSGLHIIDLDQAPPQQISSVATSGSDAKDVKVYDHYALLLNERGPIMVIDLADIANPNVILTIAPDGDEAHNCAVEGDFLYVAGVGGDGGFEIFDLSVLPEQPLKVAQFSAQYYSDLDIHNDTIYAAGIYDGGVDVIDATDKSDLRLITNFNYTGSGAHNCEVTPCGDYVFVGDEVGSSGNYIRIFDVSDLANIIQVSDMENVPGAVVHNCYERDNLLYVANYARGVRIWNVEDPAAPFEVGFYDTHLETDLGVRGCWSVYPYFASGRIIASDMQQGLYVFNFTEHIPICDCGCHGDPVCDGVTNVLDVVASVDRAFRGKSSTPDLDCPHKSRVDVNCDFEETVLDVIAFVNQAFRGISFPEICDYCACP